MDQLEKCLKKSCSAAAGAPGTSEHNETTLRETEQRKAKEEGRDEVEDKVQLLKANVNIEDIGQTREVDRSSKRRTDSIKNKSLKIKGCHF